MLWELMWKKIHVFSTWNLSLKDSSFTSSSSQYPAQRSSSSSHSYPSFFFTFIPSDRVLLRVHTQCSSSRPIAAFLHLLGFFLVFFFPFFFFVLRRQIWTLGFFFPFSSSFFDGKSECWVSFSLLLLLHSSTADLNAGFLHLWGFFLAIFKYKLESLRLEIYVASYCQHTKWESSL